MATPPNPGDQGWHYFPLTDERRDRASYRFVMPGIALSGDNVEVRVEGSSWVFAQEENGHRWEGRHPQREGALLELIAARLGVRS